MPSTSGDAVSTAPMVAIGHAPRAAQPALTALFALDAKLAGIVATTTQPIVGQMRLAWWREALQRLDTDPAPAEPLLAEVQAAILPRGVDGATLAGLVDGWEDFVTATALDRTTLARFADRRGGLLFTIGAAALGDDHPASTVAAAGKGWCLADAVARLSDPAARDHARSLAIEYFHEAFADRWPSTSRPLGMLAMIARSELSRSAAPLRDLLTLYRFKFTGR